MQRGEEEDDRHPEDQPAGCHRSDVGLAGDRQHGDGLHPFDRARDFVDDSGEEMSETGEERENRTGRNPGGEDHPEGKRKDGPEVTEGVMKGCRSNHC